MTSSYDKISVYILKTKGELYFNLMIQVKEKFFI